MPEFMSDFDWYAVGLFDDLQQGDLFLDCPLVLPAPSVYQRLLAEETNLELAETDTEPSILVLRANVMVLSQSCDLARAECTEVLVCVCHEATRYGKDQRTQIAKDRMPALHMIEACHSSEVTFPQQVIDFRAIYTLPKDFLLALAKARGRRARLLPPYREHLAQAFALLHACRASTQLEDGLISTKKEGLWKRFHSPSFVTTRLRYLVTVTSVGATTATRSGL